MNDQLYERLRIDCDMAVTSVEYALDQMGKPEGPVTVHVSPQWVATDRAWLDNFVKFWHEDSALVHRNPLQIVGDPDVKHMGEWYAECRGRRVGSPSAGGKVSPRRGR